MNRTALWRYILIILLVIVGTLYALPNIFGEDYAVQITRLASVTEHVKPLDKQQFTNQLTTILNKPSQNYNHGIKPKKIIIKTKMVGGKAVVDGDPLLLFDNGKQQEQALVQLKKGLPQAKYSIAMSMAARTPKWLQLIGAKPMTLGLDLRGGIHFLLKVDVNSLMNNQFRNDLVDITSKLKPYNKPNAKIFYDTMCPPKLINDNNSCKAVSNTFKFGFKQDQYNKDPAQRLEKFSDNYKIEKDDNKHTVTMIFRDVVEQQKMSQAMTRNMQTLSSKINKLGVAEPTIQRQGKFNISVDLPGVQDVARARAAIGTVAKVELHLAEPVKYQNGFTTRIISKNDSCNSSQFPRKVLYKNPYSTPNAKDSYVCLDPVIALPGRAIDDARAGPDPQTGKPIVSISSSGAAATKLISITAKNQHKPLATLYITTQDKTKAVTIAGGEFTVRVDKKHIATADSMLQTLAEKINNEIRSELNTEGTANKPDVSYTKKSNDYTLDIFGLDSFDKTKELPALQPKQLPAGLIIVNPIHKTKSVSRTYSEQQKYVINAATINDTFGSQFQVTFGDGQMAQAQALAKQLRSGAYAAPVSFVAQQKLGPSMGKQNIQKGVFSCLIGSLLVILFMALYYRVFGLVANLALILNVVFVVAMMSMLGATMTVPGIAGIILTVGMAVDANVLINERIREELRLGVSNQAAIKAGYERAFSTIVDANVTTLLVACVLYGLGSGTVKGFAVTLTIGLLTSMFTSIFFTRAIINLIYGNRNVKHLSIGIKVK